MTIGVASISRVISQLRDQRSPRGLSSRLILTTWTLGISWLQLRLAWHLVHTQRRGKRDLRFALLSVLTALCRYNDHTVRSSHTVEGGSGLTFQDIDALDVIRINIEGAVGIIRSWGRVTCVIIRRRSDWHTIHHIERSIVARKRTWSTDGHLGRGSWHTTGRRKVYTRNLSLQGPR